MSILTPGRAGQLADGGQRCADGQAALGHGVPQDVETRKGVQTCLQQPALWPVRVRLHCRATGND